MLGATWNYSSSSGRALGLIAGSATLIPIIGAKVKATARPMQMRKANARVLLYVGVLSYCGRVMGLLNRIKRLGCHPSGKEIPRS
jgi:hypothetical protein